PRAGRRSKRFTNERCADEPHRRLRNQGDVMADEKPVQTPNDEAPTDRSRRDFVTMSVAAGLAVAAGSASAAELPVVETSVTIKTPDGTCDAAFIHPTTGSDRKSTRLNSS